jgi:heme O synthase-like polyprenyltransferase
VNDLTKARLIYLLLIASLFAYLLALAGPISFGMSDGGGLL